MSALKKPVEGDLAPTFTAHRDGGEALSLSDFAGKTVVLYFYPKDDTPGCTKEAIEFSGMIADFEAANAVIIGVSRDTVAKHEKFRNKHDLKVVLISDEEGEITENYGVWVEKSMYGRTFMGIERSTFVINGEGTVARIWHKVKVPNHAAEVLEVVQGMDGVD